MIGLITTLIIIASVLLVFIIFIQNPKGGGLSSDFGSAQQLGGVQKTNDFIDKATWSLAGIIAVLSIIITIKTSKTVAVDNNVEAGTEQTVPTGDTNQPGQPG